MTSLVNDRKCLVVSQLKDTWDLNAKLFFVSESVVDYCCIDQLSSINYLVLDNQWNSLRYETQTATLVGDKVSRYRKELMIILNRTHGLNHDEFYWKIILDAWLINFLSVSVDRLNKVIFAKSKYPSLFIKESLSTINFPPEDAWDFMINFQTDEFNQFMFIKAAKLVGLRVEKADKESLDDTSQDNEISIKGSFVKAVVKKVLTAFLRVRNPTLILDGYFKRDDAIRIFISSLGKVVIVPSRLLLGSTEEMCLNQNFDRNVLRVEEVDQVDVLVNTLLKSCFPKSFFENFQSIISNNKSWLKHVSVLGTATCIRSSDVYKIAAAELVAKGGNLLGFQHGGASNCFSVGRFEYIETGYVSRYYGWGEKFNFGMGAQKLRRINKNISRSQCIKILFVSTGHPRNTFWVSVRENANCFLEYLEEQYIFYRTLSDEAKLNYIYRPYIQDYGWRYKERWNAEFDNEVTFDQNKKISDSFKTARVFVSDHISTTWLEALHSGLPVLMYVDIERLALLPDVVDLFHDLVEVGVIHPTPEAAAKFVSKTYENLDDWWNNVDTQKVVDKLRDYFISESDTFVSDWSRELQIYQN